eukprot:CAMPEP_0172445218 /NCGR_PEP_ID=MMETSP1065-20121228/5114_1 /TAXON_ID=265537 /ORGANISM="Amphiprora paludosa, Strain CCMP125" /LENGTH=300 /DNA_ID=CAMNT_0013196017 /DNA_START=46 /DNA_END=948 /DNA_ORIENTATION=+
MSNKGVETEESVLRNDAETSVLQPLLQAAEESKKSNLATIRSIVMKVLSEPKIFAGYDQIKATLQEALSSGGAEGAKLSHSLDLFSYGTYLDYQSNTSQYLDLTTAQTLKLRQLSALTVVQQACLKAFQQKGKGGSKINDGHLATIPYQEFERALQFSNVAENPGLVEDVLVSCLYMGVFRGKLCQQTRSLLLSPRYPIRPRDVPVAQVPIMADQIRSMLSLLQNATSSLELQKDKANNELQTMTAFWKQVEERRKKNESASMMRWDATTDVAFGDASGSGTTRRQKRGRAAASGDQARY